MSVLASADSPEVSVLTSFIDLLTALQTAAQAANLDGRSLQRQFLHAQQFYQTQLLPTLVSSPSAEGLMSYQTEINRALRLLGLDVSCLQSAKRSLTAQKRQAQMLERLNTLLAFCQGLQDAMTA